jgi:hypothetical protein
MVLLPAGKSAKKRRARGAAASRKVAEAAALDIDEFQFNSSQQLQELRSGWHQQHAPQAAAAGEQFSCSAVNFASSCRRSCAAGVTSSNIR